MAFDGVVLIRYAIFDTGSTYSKFESGLDFTKFINVDVFNSFDRETFTKSSSIPNTKCFRKTG